MNAVVAEMGEPERPEDRTLLAMISRAAHDPETDVEKLERLMMMYERIEAKRAETAFNDAMMMALSKVGRIAADAVNSQTRSNYATYAKLDRVLRPIYTECGFSLSFDTGPDAPPDHVRVICYVSHKAGHSRTYHADLPADGKGAKGGDVMTKTHAFGSGVSYGMRYLLKMIFNVAVGEEDDDGNAASGYDASDWYSAIDGAGTMDELNRLAAELKSAEIPKSALRSIRAAWAKRAKELK
jgi:hypothetical protein